MTRLLPAMIAICLLPGCGKHWAERRYDNPKVRALQKQSMAGFPERPIAGQSLPEFFRGKVALVETEGLEMPSGRAAAITRDGYFLTAFHVVNDGAFFVSELVVLKPLAPGTILRNREEIDAHFREDRHEGRVVWHDEAADLAIVKFDWRPDSRLTGWNECVPVGAAVFSAAVDGELVTAGSVAEGVGNGPFETAGIVTHARPIAEDGRFRVYESTLVGRAGMSGAPVVDANGRLAGILIDLQRSRHWGVNPGIITRFSMLDPECMSNIVAADRRRSAGR